MGQGRKNPAWQCRGDIRDRHAARSSDEVRWNPGNLEDDPLGDLRPHDDDMLDAAGDEYIWPDLSEENNEDD